MSHRPADIVSPVTDAALAPKTAPAAARAAGRFGYDKPTPQNSVVLLVDHQIGLMVGVRYLDDQLLLPQRRTSRAARRPSAGDRANRHS